MIASASRPVYSSSYCSTPGKRLWYKLCRIGAADMSSQIGPDGALYAKSFCCKSVAVVVKVCNIGSLILADELIVP